MPEAGEQDIKKAAQAAASSMEQSVQEGKSPHAKGSKKYKAHMAAMHANETTKDSIKEQLLAKLKARK